MPHTFRNWSIIAVFTLLFTHTAFAQHDGDTTMVQTFTFGSPQNAKFLFPAAGADYQKVLMLYTLKCNPAQSPACGEWDYLTYTNLYKHLGVYDSTLLYQPSYIFNGGTPDSAKYMTSPSYRYVPHFERFIVYTDTLTLTTATLGTGNDTTDETVNTMYADGKAQYLWTAAELGTAGLTAGNITGLRLNFSTAGSALQNFSVRIKASTLTQLADTAYETTAFTTVYSAATAPAAGWNSLAFTTPFNWDGTSNLVVEFVFDNHAPGTASQLLADNTGWASGVHNAENDNILEFDGGDYVAVPPGAFADIDSQITIAFWQYGDPAFQPQDNSIFEGFNSQGQRVLNVHLPWGNGNVYWDAGTAAGALDRIEKAAIPVNYEGRWNHWAFTKDVTTGLMRAYLNGNLFHSGTNKRTPMTDVVNFKIGSFANGTQYFYDGMLNEFQVWNKALDQATIKAWMNKDVDATHPFYSNLQLYYQFNDGTGATTADASGNGHTGTMLGLPEWMSLQNGENVRNMQNTQLRPYTIFEQGTFDSYIDSVLVIDTIENAPVSVITYTNANDPTTPTDTLYGWPTYYNGYVYDTNGYAIDSTLVPADVTLYLTQLPYYGEPFELVETVEIGRYITPYGNGLDLGAGFTWLFDVSDYVTLLHDSVHLSAGNWQELLDLKFMFIHGTPPRDVVKIENVWAGDYGLSTIDQTILPQTISLDPGASTFRLKTRASGHGWDNSTNCAEFCPKEHSVLVNGNTISSWTLWKDCGFVPVFPQGGTWLIDRAGWCPGEPVNTYDHEITPYLNDTATQVTLDYDAESDQWGNYVFHSQFVQYSAPNFEVDAAVTDIIAPSTKDIWARYNPACDNPIIVIQNTGAEDLTELDIAYGVDGGRDCYYTWNGRLKFLETDTVALPAFDWTGTTDSTRRFHVSVSYPNGEPDGYAYNNTNSTEFETVPLYDSVIVLALRTNLDGAETHWELRNEYDSLMYAGDGYAGNTNYTDTFRLAPGCYAFTLYDRGEDGLSFFANNSGNGTARLRKVNNTNIITLQANFGEKISQHFMVGYKQGYGPAKDTCAAPVHIIDTTGTGIAPVDKENIYVYPNPAGDKFFIRLDYASSTDATIRITNNVGMLIEERLVKQATTNLLEINMNHQPAGIYFISVATAQGMQVRKLVLSR